MKKRLCQHKLKIKRLKASMALLTLATCHLFFTCSSLSDSLMWPATMGLEDRSSRRPLGLASLSTDLRRLASTFANSQVKSSRVPVGLRRIQQKRALEQPKNVVKSQEHKFFYVIAPVSEQALPFQSDRLAQGYTNLLPLSDSYKTGLQKLALYPADEPIETTQSGPDEVLTNWAVDYLGCRSAKALVQLAKDELDPASGRPVRHCTGTAELNTCEGSCSSSVQPSIKSRNGFAKNCACCNEGSFKRVQVRLDECFAVDSGDQTQPPVRLPPASFMDLEVEEPSECKCRPCDSLL